MKIELSDKLIEKMTLERQDFKKKLRQVGNKLNCLTANSFNLKKLEKIERIIEGE